MTNKILYPIAAIAATGATFGITELIKAAAQSQEPIVVALATIAVIPYSIAIGLLLTSIYQNIKRKYQKDKDDPF